MQCCKMVQLKSSLAALINQAWAAATPRPSDHVTLSNQQLMVGQPASHSVAALRAPSADSGRNPSQQCCAFS